MQEEYGDKTDEWPPFAAPREIAKVIRTFDEWTKTTQARTEYSFLSEFAHPNMAAFSHYYKMEPGEAGFGVVTFFQPRRFPSDGEHYEKIGKAERPCLKIPGTTHRG